MKKWSASNGVFSILGWLILSGSLSAQGSAVPQFDFEFTIMATDRLKDVAYVQLKPAARSKSRPVAADFEVIPVRVNSQGRSDVYRFQGPGPIRFVRTQGSKEALTVKRVLATWNGPSWRGSSFVALMPLTEEKLEVFAFNDDKTVHGARQVRLLNVSGLKVAGVLGGSTFELTPAVQVSDPRPVSGNLKVGVTYERFGKPVVAFDQSLIVSGNERLLLVFLPPFRPGADVRTRVVRDQLRAPVEEN